MSETSHNSLILKKSNQVKVNNLINAFAKLEPNVLKFTELFHMLLDRCIFNNRLPFSIAYDIFENATKIRSNTHAKKQIQTADKTIIQQRHLTRDQFMYFISELGKVMYRDDINYQDKVFNELLSEKLSADKNMNIQNARVLSIDEINKKLIGEVSVSTYIHYEKDLKALFNSYIFQNYWTVKKHQRFLLSERQIDLQNKKMEAATFVAFLKQSQICPHLIGIQHVQQIMRVIVPYSNSKQQDFYYKHYLVDVYNRESQKLETTRHHSDPGILFFEFQIILGRIAFETYPKQNQKKTFDAILQYLFSRHLLLRHNQKTHEQIKSTKKHLIKLKDYYLKYSKEEQVQSTLHKNLNNQNQKDPRMRMAELQQAELNLNNSVDLVDILKTLEKQLPKLPPKHQPKQHNKPPFNDQRIIIGQVPPPEEKEDDKNKKEQKKQNKKEQDPGRVFPWADVPKPILTSENYFQQLASKLAFQTKPLSSLERGALSVEPIPTLVCQLLFPPQLPQVVEPYLKAGRNSMIQKNFYLALKNYNDGYLKWKEFLKKKSEDMPYNIELYFDYTKGSILASAGRDDYALLTFYNCRKHVESGKMGFVNPDRALPYCGIGQILYEIEEYQLSARAYLKARQIREGILGIENVQTANVFCNLGACFFMLNRATEALGYTEIAEAVFSAQLGPYHQRTMNARANLKKISRGTFQHIPQYKKLWQVYQKDEFQGKKKKKGAAKKK